MSNTPLSDQISALLGGRNIKDIFRELMKELFPLPAWSTLSEPVVQTVKTSTIGAFGLGYYFDPTAINHETRSMGDIMVVLNKRPGINGQPDKYAATGGGFNNPGDEKTAGEQPNENASREISEETKNDQNVAILDIAPERLKLVLSGVDYRRPHAPTQYSGHLFELTRAEYEAMKTHGQKLDTDPAYREAVKLHTNGEVTGYAIMSLSQAMALPPEQLAHPHELKALDFVRDTMLQNAISGTQISAMR